MRKRNATTQARHDRQFARDQERAETAEAEVAEWEERFDALLARVPKTEPLS